MFVFSKENRAKFPDTIERQSDGKFKGKSFRQIFCLDSPKKCVLVPAKWGDVSVENGNPDMVVRATEQIHLEEQQEGLTFLSFGSKQINFKRKWASNKWN